MTMKTCVKCRNEKPAESFYRHTSAKDGLRSACKECVAITCAKYREQNRDRCKAYDSLRNRSEHRLDSKKAYRRTEAGKAVTRKASAAKRLRSPLKYAAVSAVGRAVRDGKLSKQPCEVCGGTNVEAHHDDYSKPLDIRWLCVEHHREHHRKEKLSRLQKDTHT